MKANQSEINRADLSNIAREIARDLPDSPQKNQEIWRLENLARETSIEKSVSTIDMACEILQKTDDGDELSPTELLIIQDAVNDWNNLTEAGKEFFQELYTKVQEGTFIPFQQRPFNGIENLTADHRGAGGGLWILWRGKQIEHYSCPFAYTEHGKKEAQRIASICRKLEEKGIKITTKSVMEFSNSILEKEGGDRDGI